MSHDFGDEEQRARWSNFPTKVVPRGGVALRDLDETQRRAAMTLLASALSSRGLEKVRQIMGADDAFKASAGARDDAMFGSDLYYFSILGAPSADEPWMLQFGGHHLALTSPSPATAARLRRASRARNRPPTRPEAPPCVRSAGRTTWPSR